MPQILASNCTNVQIPPYLIYLFIPTNCQPLPSTLRIVKFYRHAIHLKQISCINHTPQWIIMIMRIQSQIHLVNPSDSTGLSFVRKQKTIHLDKQKSLFNFSEICHGKQTRGNRLWVGDCFVNEETSHKRVGMGHVSKPVTSLQTSGVSSNSEANVS